MLLFAELQFDKKMVTVRHHVVLLDHVHHHDRDNRRDRGQNRAHGNRHVTCVGDLRHAHHRRDHRPFAHHFYHHLIRYLKINFFLKLNIFQKKGGNQIKEI